jgi:hypothetical protein
LEDDIRHLEASMISQLLNDPLIAPLWAFALLSLAVFVLTIWRSIEASQFDVNKLPKLLDTLVLQKLVPLAILGVAAKTVSDATVGDALVVAYIAGIVAAGAAEVRQLIDAVKGDTFPPEIAMTDSPNG